MMNCKVKASCTYLHTNLILGSITKAQQLHAPAKAGCGPSPILRSSSCLTSTASLTLWSGWVRFSQAIVTARGVISEKRALHTCRLGFTAEQKEWPRSKPSHTALSS